MRDFGELFILNSSRLYEPDRHLALQWTAALARLLYLLTWFPVGSVCQRRENLGVAFLQRRREYALDCFRIALEYRFRDFSRHITLGPPAGIATLSRFPRFKVVRSFH